MLIISYVTEIYKCSYVYIEKIILNNFGNKYGQLLYTKAMRLNMH